MLEKRPLGALRFAGNLLGGEPDDAFRLNQPLRGIEDLLTGILDVHRSTWLARRVMAGLKRQPPPVAIAFPACGGTRRSRRCCVTDLSVPQSFVRRVWGVYYMIIVSAHHI